MPFGPIRVPRISRPTGIGAVGSSSSMNIPANNGFHLNVGRRRSLGRKAKQRYLHAPMSIPDYGSMTTASGAETPQRLEDVTEVSEELRPGSSLSDQNQDRFEDSMFDEDEVDILSYQRTVRFFALIPVVSFFLFIILFFLPGFIWPTTSPKPTNTWRYAYAFITSTALWSLSHLLRVPLYKFTLQVVSALLSCYRYMNPENITGSAKLLHTIVFTILQEFIRISALAILAIHLYGYPEGDGSTSLGEVSPVDDPSFFEVWLIGLGWAVAEVCASIAQGYELLSAYEDMFAPRNPLADVETQSAIDLVNQYRDIEEEIPGADDVALIMGGVGIKDTGNDIDDALLDLDVALTRLVNAKARDDLEAVYGVPFIDIPVFIHILHKVDSFLLSIGLTLMLSAAYVSTFTPTPTTPPQMHILHFWPTFVVATAVHVFLGVLHTPPVLPYIGVPAASYIACLVGLGVFFVGIGFWGGLS